MKEIKLSKGYKTMVDDKDYEKYSKYSWHYCNGYAARSEYQGKKGKHKTIFLHREIVNPPIDLMVDHKNRNQLDNTRKNLRVCTRSCNAMNRLRTKKNSSGFKGVYWNGELNKWHVTIMKQQKAISLGYYKDLNKASEVYEAKAKELFGEFYCSPHIY